MASTRLTTSVTPLTYGNGGATGATFVPWYDASYLLAALYTPAQLTDVYSGKISWTDPKIHAQLAKWQQLSKRGYLNADALTSRTNFRDFETGKAAMIVDGSFDAAQFSKALGGDLAAFAPPFSDQPVKQVVEFAGGGYAITKSSQHRADAAKFLDFLGTPEASAILEANGLIPNLVGYQPKDALSKQLTGFAASDGYTPYPMLDNIVQPEVVDVGSRQLPSVLASGKTPDAALSSLQAALQALPADRRGTIK